jgi:uncharacterized protein (DUF2164 family)
MSIELPKERRKEAIASIIRYFQENREEEIGNIVAGELLEFFTAEIAPSIYNKAVADILERMQMQLTEIDIDFNQEEFQYWNNRDRQRRQR